MKKLKIAIIGHKRIPSREGGVEIVVEELAIRLQKAGHEVHVYNRMDKLWSANKGSKRKFQYKGVRIITIPTINTKGLDAFIYSVFATLRALVGKYDVIHYHAEGPSVMIFLPHILGVKTVATIHGLDWQRAKWGGFATKYIKLGEKNIAKFANEIIVLSKNVQGYFKDVYGRSARYIPNGVNEPVIREADCITKQYGLTKDSYILFLARMVPEKGLHYLIEAFSHINTDKRLVVAGGSSHSNEYIEEIEAMAKKDSRVLLTGFVDGVMLEELFSNCYVYVLPSDVEGMPISLLEAMSYGCPCVVSDIEENVEVMGEQGIYFQKSNVESLEKILSDMLMSSDHLWEREGKRKYYDMARFNWDKVADKNLEVYYNILEMDEKDEYKKGLFDRKK